MHILGISLIAGGVAGLLYLAAHIAWQEFKTLRYLHDLDKWAEDVQTWQ